MDIIHLTDDSFIELLNTITKISKRPLLIAIDGRCTSGKSTLASKLSEKMNASILHMDDFFLRIEQRTPERYKEPGGNVDIERIIEVIHEYLEHKSISYAPFNCKLNKLDPVKNIAYKDILIVEGSYSMHRELINFYDYKIFMTVPYDTQIERIRKRNGEKMLNMFIDKWIPLEEIYFKAFKVEEEADIVFDTSKE